VLNAPDYTRTCTCSYQNQCSLALVHDPKAEMWTWSRAAWTGGAVRRVGINFGAPGDRVADNGTLWLEHPAVGGPSPTVPVILEPRGATKSTDSRGREITKSVYAGHFFRHHSSLFRGKDLSWVGSSGAEGVTRITFSAGGEKGGRNYAVRMVFAEPDLRARAGDRVFSVKVQGKPFLTDFDITRAAGGSRRVIVREISTVRIAEALTIEFTAKAGRSLISGVEVVLRADHSRGARDLPSQP
jgi:hypothetical protein